MSLAIRDRLRLVRRTGSRRRPGRRSPRARRGRRWRPAPARSAGTSSPGPSGARAADRHRRVAGDVGGDRLALVGRDQRAHLGRLVERVADRASPRPRCSSAAMNSSSAERSTRIRERAQQSWPALPKTASGAAAAAASRSASAKTTFADLPPSSSVTRLIVAGRARGDPAPDLGRAGEGDLGDVGMLDQALPADAARARRRR